MDTKLIQTIQKILKDFEVKIGDLEREIEDIKENVPDLDIVLDHMKGEKGDKPVYGVDWNLSEEEIQAILEAVKPVAGVDYKIPKDGRDAVISQELINKIVSTVQSTVRDGKDGRDGVDGIDGLDGSPDEPKDIVKKLQSLKGDARLDKSAIKGLETVIGQSDLDRAIEILDKRTQYLINKVTTSSGGGGPVTGLTGNPKQVVYIDNLGNGTGDGLFTRDSMTNETTIAFQTYATGAVNDGISQEVRWRADNQGTIGNSISLVFNGVDDTDTVLANWNAANPSNTISVVGGTGNFVPSAQTVTFGGGGIAGYYETLDLLGQGFQYAGSLYSDGANKFIANGLLDTGDAGIRPSISAIDFATGEQSIIQVETNRIDIRSDSASDSTQLSFEQGLGVRLQYNSSVYGLSGIEADAAGRLKFYSNSYQWIWATADGTNGQALVTDGAGNLSFATITATAPLTQNYIGFGDASNVLTGDTSFQYDLSNLQFTQTVPNNTGNSGATTSPLSFGAASFTGSGLDDLTLTWDSTIYKSKKYGGNLQIQITQTSPDKFSWTYTGSYSETIGSGTDVAITPGLPQILFDSQGRHIADITFASGSGHTMGDRWNAGTSLSSYTWGSVLTDGSRNFMVSSPVIGQYFGGDAQYLSYLGGSGTRWEITDTLGEFGIFAPRYFRVEAPGGNTAVLADMENDIWKHYTSGFYIRNTGDTNTWLTTDGNGGTTQIGNVSGAKIPNSPKVSVISHRVPLPPR